MPREGLENRTKSELVEYCIKVHTNETRILKELEDSKNALKVLQDKDTERLKSRLCPPDDIGKMNVQVRELTSENRKLRLNAKNYVRLLVHFMGSVEGMHPSYMGMDDWEREDKWGDSDVSDDLGVL